MKKGFTLIELLVVIAIIAILAAILFPVFSKAKESAKKTAAIAQMKQLAMAVMMYAEAHDDYFVPASNRPPDGSSPVIWPPLVNEYAKSEQIFIAPGSTGKFAGSWAERKEQTVGYSDATGIDTINGADPFNAPPGTEGFKFAVNFSQAELPAKVGLFATTPGGTNKQRGYVFNPYNGPDSPDGDYMKGLPLVADVDLTTTPYKGQDYTTLSPGQLKPIMARYHATRQGHGVSPVIFADGHCKSHSANAMGTFGEIIWRFR